MADSIHPDRERLIHLTVDQYFAAIDDRRVDDALSLFHDTASFTLYPSGTCHRGVSQIRAMFDAIFARHGQPKRRIVDMCVDVDSGLVCATFTASFENDNGDRLDMNNVNLWKVDEMRISWMKVFTSDPSF